MNRNNKSAFPSLPGTTSRLGSSLSTFALLLAGLTIITACGSGSSSPTEPPADPISFDATTSDDGTFGSSSGAEVDGLVTGVESGSQTIFLANGDRVIVDFNTIWDPLGDLVSFSQLENAFKAGQIVRVEADGRVVDPGVVLAATIKAETDDDGPNDDGPNDNDPDDDSDFDDDIDSDLDDDIDSDDSDSGDDSDDSDDVDSDGDDSDSEDSDSSDSDSSNSGGSGPG